MNFVDHIGERAIMRWQFMRDTVATLCGVFYLMARPRYWPRTVRAVVGRQILFTGIDALGLILLISLLAGVSVVAQAQLWLSRFGQSEMLGRLLVAIIVGEAGPLLVNLVVIGRSGTAIATELATMRVRREVDVLETQGIDPMVYLVMPRVIGIFVSVFSLTILFILGSFVSGYIFGFFLQVGSGTPARFMDSVFQAMTPGTVASLAAKTLIPGLLTGTICCLEGLSVLGAATEVPQAATRAVVKSMIALLLVSAVASVLTYV